MKRLYVGCRVRINAPDVEVHGREARILGMDVRGNDFGRSYIGCEIDIPGVGKSCAIDGRWIFEAHELEPIIDPGHQVISWADMADLWTPSGVEA